MAYLGQRQNINTGAFGELVVAQPNGEIQLQFPYNLNPELISVTTASSGTVISSPPFAVVSTGLSPTGSAFFQSKYSSHYRTGEGVAVVFTSIFTSGTGGSVQYVGLGDSQDGFFFGYNGEIFGILYRKGTYGVTVTQVTVTDTWIPQVSWNQDPFNGTGASGVVLDPTKGNVYKIQMEWLGFGDINFFIENPNNGDLTFVHKILYSNLNTNTSVLNPSLPLRATATNSTNTKNMVVKVPSMASFIEGPIFQNDIIYSISDSGNGDVANIINLLAIRNVSTFNNIVNSKVVVLSAIAMSVVGGTATRAIRFYLILNPTNAFTYVSVNANQSCVQYDSTSTATITGGRTLFVFYIEGQGEQNIDLTSYNIYLNPGDVLSVAIQRINNGARTASTNLTWIERF